MNSNQIRNTKTTLEFVPNFCTRTLWSTHNNCNIRTNLHSLFNHIKSMTIPESRTLLHFLHNFCNNRSMLLIRSKITNQICSWNHFVISTNLKTIFRSIFPGLTLFFNSTVSQSVTNIQTRIAQTHSLI